MVAANRMDFHVHSHTDKTDLHQQEKSVLKECHGTLRSSAFWCQVCGEQCTSIIELQTHLSSSAGCREILNS